MADQGDRKTVRAFQCRDYLYEIYDRLSDELECSVDYLINEAMREYARSREQMVAGLGAQQTIRLHADIETGRSRIETALLDTLTR